MSLDYTVPDEAPNGIYQLILTGQGEHESMGFGPNIRATVL